MAICSICLDETDERESARVVSLRCGHIFHETCITNWIQVSEKCPTCKQKALKTEFRRLFLTTDRNRFANDGNAKTAMTAQPPGQRYPAVMVTTPYMATPWTQHGDSTHVSPSQQRSVPETNVPMQAGFAECPCPMRSMHAPNYAMFEPQTVIILGRGQQAFTLRPVPYVPIPQETVQGNNQIHRQLAITRNQPLTSEMLTGLTPQDQKRVIGERLFPLVQRINCTLAGKITGMLLELDKSDLLMIMQNPQALKGKVDEAVILLQTYGQGRNAVGGASGSS